MKQIRWKIYARTFTSLMTMAGKRAEETLLYLGDTTDAIRLAQRIHHLSREYPDLWIQAIIEEM